MLGRAVHGVAVFVLVGDFDLELYFFLPALFRNAHALYFYEEHARDRDQRAQHPVQVGHRVGRAALALARAEVLFKILEGAAHPPAALGAAELRAAGQECPQARGLLAEVGAALVPVLQVRDLLAQ